MGRQFQRLAPFAILLAGLVLVALATIGFARIANEADRERFLSLVDDRQSRISRQVDRHIALLNGTLALFHAYPGPVDYDAFRRFVEGLNLKERFDGILGLGYAVRVKADELPAAESLLNTLYGSRVKIWPRFDQGEGYPVLYLRPEADVNSDRLGFDMFSDPVRRAALERARDTGAPSASAPVELVQEASGEPQQAFLIVLPHYEGRAAAGDPATRQAAIRGFVYGLYRAGDFFSSALFPSARSPVRLLVYDEAAGPGQQLFNSHTGSSADQTLSERRVMSVAGRHWILEYSAGEGFRSILPGAVLAAFVAVGLLLAGAAAAVVHFQVQALQHAERDADLAKSAQAEKELLLQEMKHRIKNSLTRVAAMSRQTARTAGSLEDFVASFDARLRAMSTSQDLLTRSRWEKAWLRDLLRAEIIPVLGEDETRYHLHGPDLVVGAREALALGLTFHELATNALKYGGLAEESAQLHVGWKVLGTGTDRRLQIEWQEKAALSTGQPGEPGESANSGFGSKLIKMSIVDELGGTIERDYRPEGFSAVITIPLRDGGE